MAKLEQVNLVWLTGASCDGCTIKALGDTSAGGLEAFLTGSIPGLPRVRLIHPVLSPESGTEFMALLQAAGRGELEPFGIVNESSIPDERMAGDGFFSSLGEEGGEPVPMGEWMTRLAPRAMFVVAWGDCGVWGGPHSLDPNPSGAMGTAMYLGEDYRSTLGLPVVNLPGCAPPPVLTATLATILAWAQGEGPPLELDDLDRPRLLYPEIWTGAFVAWKG